ncbi:MAG: family 78 glycoside hydrolase catalytic domain [Cytophagaceae bacterium]|nr:family 78 glycoside hydrolase catalytic domain [Cytophagaceae bacterium]
MKKILALVLAFTLNGAFAQLNLSHLKTNNLTNPIGIEPSAPRFNWVLETSQKNTVQTSYEIEVKEAGKSIWRSGKINDAQSVFVKYAGPALKSDTRYSWTVKVTDNHGQNASASATFQSGIKASEIQAKWINSGLKKDTVNGIVPMFRKTFSAKKTIVQATVYVTSRGLYELNLNGKRVGDAQLAPGWTTYNKHLQVNAYDVTSQMQSGQNVIGAYLGSGWYRTRLAWENQKNVYGKETALLAQINIKYKDGSRQTIISDGSWKVTESQIIYSEIYDGETIDARKMQSEAFSIKFDNKNWQNAVEKDFKTDYLTLAINEPIKKHQELKPMKLIITPKGDKVLDFGQNMVGWISANITGTAGSKVTFRHFEMLDKYGNPYFENNRSAKAQANFILSGKSDFFEPKFTFFGFRYVKIEGIENINLNDFTGHVLYSDMNQTGTFECSNPLVNQLQKNIQWGQRGNFLDVPTDCPQRDERLGWTGDAEVFSRTAAYNFGVNQFFAKWLKDLAFDQGDNGAVPHVIPDVLRGDPKNQPQQAAGWGDAGMIIPYNMYVVYGDRKILEEQYPSMQASINYIRSVAKNDLWNTGFQFADWLSYRVDDSKGMIGQKSAVTDNYLVAQAFFAYCTDIMQKTATILGKSEDAKEYSHLLERVKKQFQNEFMTASGRLISETQTAYVLALAFDLIPENLREQAVQRLVDNIKSYDFHLTTGFLGTPFLNPVLSKFGQHETAYKLLLQDTYPSWLYPIKAHGATTIWERWDSMKPDSTFQDPGMTSFNHYAYGAVGDWMYRNVAGIDTKDATGSGYKEIIIKPIPGGGLTQAKGNLLTSYGIVSSEWKIEGKKFFMTVEIPVNSSAEITFPAKNIKENGQSVVLEKGKMKVGSGKYVFEGEM